MTWQRTTIRDEKTGSSATVAVIAALVTIAPGRPGDFYGSVPRLMSLSRLSERSVRGALAGLQRDGYLFQVQRGGRRGVRAEASTWRLILPQPAPDAEWGPVDNPDSGIPNLHEQASQSAPSAVPREEDFQERSRNHLHRSGTDRARETDDAAEGVKLLDTSGADVDDLVGQIASQVAMP